MALETSPSLNPWQPERSALRLAVLRKLSEELGELAAAVSRSLIQGISEREPVTGKPNAEWVEEEVADVLAAADRAIAHFNLNVARIRQRQADKIAHLRRWHSQLGADATTHPQRVLLSETGVDDTRPSHGRAKVDLARELLDLRMRWAACENAKELAALQAQINELRQRQEAIFSLSAHLSRQRAWSEATFGPGSRVKGTVKHIRKELKEIEADPGDLREWIDVAILAFDGAWRSGASPGDIIAALVAKQAENEARQWPDWRTAKAGEPIEHIRDREPSAHAVRASQRCASNARALSREQT